MPSWIRQLAALFFPSLLEKDPAPLSTHEEMPEEEDLHKAGEGPAVPTDLQDPTEPLDPPPVAAPIVPPPPVSSLPSDSKPPPADTVTAPVSGRKYPTGKGVFIQTVEKATRTGTPEALAGFCENLGMDWAMLLVLWQHDKRDRKYDADKDEDQILDVVEAAHALRAKGIDPWIWGWAQPGSDRIDTFVKLMRERYDATGAVGIVLNIEKPYYGRKGSKRKGYVARFAADAKKLMIALRREFGASVPIGLSSYGAKHVHETSFPWGVFALYCDFGMPQIYDSEHGFGPGYPQRCFDSWRQDFEIVIPTWGASKAHTSQQMRGMTSRTPIAPAVSWWDLNHLRYSSARQGVVREYVVTFGETPSCDARVS